MRAGAVERQERPDGRLAWCTQPAALQGGQRARLLYDAAAGPLVRCMPGGWPPQKNKEKERAWLRVHPVGREHRCGSLYVS